MNSDTLRNIGMALSGLSAGIQGRGAEFANSMAAQQQAEETRRQKLSMERQQAMAIDARVVRDHLENALNPDGTVRDQKRLSLAMQLAKSREQKIAELGGDPSETQAFVSALEQDPMQALNLVRGFDMTAQEQGFVSKYEPPKLQESVYDEPRKELRATLRKSVEGLNSEISAINTNYGKLQGLAEQVKKGNRSAVSQMLVSLVKLGDPGSVVKESEMEAALNSENPLSYLVSKGVNQGLADSLLKNLDSLSPEKINVDEVLRTGQALISANAPDIIERYEMAKERGGEFLTQAGFDSIFGKSFEDRVNKLRGFNPKPTKSYVIENHPIYGNVTEDQIQATMKENSMSREQVLQQLGVR